MTDFKQTTLLVLNAQSGEKSAFDELCKRYYQPSWLFALKLARQPTLADDICQEVWCSVAINIKKLKEPSAFRAWLFSAIYHQFLDQLKKNTRFTELQNDTEYECDPDLDSQIGMIKLINLLDYHERSVIYLFYYEQLSLQDVAIILSVPMGTVKSRLHRARMQLQALLERGEHYEH
ncbi:RNA polymerase sigma-54 factor RpoN [Pseudoalteromonas luteoviolacea B = ATCC 29581]|nr:RNA polymerase sigma-54 factor RpoN [Pseudoalteromonas luteoviolacea B = ATCC 29581]